MDMDKILKGITSKINSWPPYAHKLNVKCERTKCRAFPICKACRAEYSRKKPFASQITESGRGLNLDMNSNSVK
jgi:hypothetical protein